MKMIIKIVFNVVKLIYSVSFEDIDQEGVAKDHILFMIVNRQALD